MPHGNDYYCSRALCSVHVHVHLECAGSDVLVAGMNIRSMYASAGSGAYVCRRFLLTYLLTDLLTLSAEEEEEKQALLVSSYLLLTRACVTTFSPVASSAGWALLPCARPCPWKSPQLAIHERLKTEPPNAAGGQGGPQKPTQAPTAADRGERAPLLFAELLRSWHAGRPSRRLCVWRHHRCRHRR